MNELYTVVAGFAVFALMDVVKIVGKWFNKVIPGFPAWVKNLVPLWKLLAAIVVTILVVWVSRRFAVEFQNPVVVLVIAQIAHEITDAIRKARAEVS
jgi:hypothetical protein